MERQHGSFTIPRHCESQLTVSTDSWPLHSHVYFHHLLRSPTYKAYIKTASTGVVDSRLRLTQMVSSTLCYSPPPTPPRAGRHRPLPGPRRPAHPPLRRRQAQAHRPAGGGEAGHRQPGRHPRPRPQRPPQALRRRMARRVPEHWAVRRLRSLVAIGTGGRDTINRREDATIPLLCSLTNCGENRHLVFRW